MSRAQGGSSRGKPGRGEVFTDPRLLFAADGPLSIRKPGYSERPEQVDLARAVEECFDSKSVLLADAPTGTGKSLRYLPAYCPHLNLIEGVWRRLKGFLMPRRFYDSVTELKEAVLDALSLLGAVEVQCQLGDT